MRNFWLSLLFVIGVVACKKEVPAPPPPPETQAPAAPAIVNGVPIDAAQFQAEVDKITQGGARNIPDDRMAKIKENVLNRMIEEELLRQEYKRQGIEVTNEEIEAEFQKYKSRFKTEEQFQNYLTHGKTSVEEIKARQRDSIALNKLLTKLGKLDVSEEDVKKAYETGIKMYTEPEQVHARHILIKVAENAPAADVGAAKKKIAEIQAKLAKGESFENLAKQYSEDPMSKEKGGDLGFFRKGVMVPKFEAAAFALKPGEITKEPVRTPFGFHLIQVLERKEERVKPFEEVKEQIVESLKNRNLFKARRELVDNLKATAKIEKPTP